MSVPADRARARVQAQAKVNLFLHVGARETSGYHRLQTLFARLELADVVDVRAGAAHWTVDGGAADLGPPDRNLAVRAAREYATVVGWPPGGHITIAKHIPVGGGLGGGSADAGAVLRALNALNPHAIDPAALPAIGAAIGADVPFLTGEDVFALGEGRGERLRALPPLPPRVVALLVPPFSISTADAYGWLDADRRARGGTTAGGPRQPHVAQLASWESLAPRAGNDFTDPVERRHLLIARMRAALDAAGAELSLLSGSGSTVFGIFEKVPDLTDVATSLGCRVIITRTASHVVPVHRIE